MDPAFDPASLDARSRGVWRYRHTLPVPSSVKPCTLGEGATPIVEGRVDGQSAFFKLEQLNPTGSFKDRGTSVLVTLLAACGVMHVVEDSSGNAGASLAAYCARAGIGATLFCPQSTSAAKARQIELYGAELVRVPGPRHNATTAAKHAATRDVVYASHVRNPVGLAGMATAAFEIWEQMERMPRTIVAPIGQGTLILGLYRGFASLRRAGRIASLPRLIGVQAERCAPMTTPGDAIVAPADATELPTLAEGIRIPDPIRTREVFAAIADSRGAILTASEASIREGVEALARQGLHVEPTSAVVWSALRQLAALGRLESVVAMLTGHGLKTPTMPEERETYCPPI
jgi:threonine synthase